jgi:hypothetical protein
MPNAGPRFVEFPDVAPPAGLETWGICRDHCPRNRMFGARRARRDLISVPVAVHLDPSRRHRSDKRQLLVKQDT